MSIAKNVKNKALVTYAKLFLVFSAIMCATAWPAYADISESNIKSMISSTIDVVFIGFSGVIALIGAFSLIPGLVHFIQASQSQNGEQRREAGSGIAVGIGLMLLALLVWQLKTPLKTLIS